MSLAAVNDAPPGEEDVLAVGVTGAAWRMRDVDPAAVRALRHELSCDETTARLLAARGVGAEEAARVIAPKLRDLLPDPHILSDMEAAAARIARAVTAGERLAVFADYDADGLTAGAVVIDFLRAAGLEPVTYVPDRLREGYGPTPEAMRALAQAGVTLTIMVDCGSAAHEAIAAASGEGLDVVVFDHHPTEDPAPARAVVNPHRAGDDSGLTQLSAGGVAFLGCLAAARVLRADGHDLSAYDPFASLDLVAVGAICDVTPLTGLNRALVVQGLKVLSRGERPGFAALMETGRITAPLSVRDVGFAIGPRLNAAGRLGQAGTALRLLLARDERHAGREAAALEAMNRERRARQDRMVREAVAAAGAVGDDQSVVFVEREGWSVGLAGLAASRLVERFARPAFVAGRETGEDLLKGSARSVPGVDVGAAVRAGVASGLFKTGGGHAMAAGFTLEAAGVAEARAFLNEACAMRTGIVERFVDLVITPGAARTALRAVEALAPFGPGFEEPNVMIDDARLGGVETFGSGHLKLRLEGRGGVVVEALSFGGADGPLHGGAQAAAGAPVRVLGRLGADRYRGVALMLDDLAVR